MEDALRIETSHPLCTDGIAQASTNACRCGREIRIRQHCGDDSSALHLAHRGRLRAGTSCSSSAASGRNSTRLDMAVFLIGSGMVIGAETRYDGAKSFDEKTT